MNYAKSFYIQYRNTDPFSGKRLSGKPMTRKPLCGAESAVKAADDQKKWMMSMHFPICALIIRPMKKQAVCLRSREVKFSLVSNRGCFGGCSFCALDLSSGTGSFRYRSHESIIEEAKHDYEGTRLQRIYPRCRWSDSKFQGTCL